MNVLVRVGGFFVTIAAVSLLAAALGAAVGPLGTAEPDPADHGTSHQEGTGHQEGTSDREGGAHASHGDHEAAGPPAGLQVSQDGYQLSLGEDTVAPGPQVPLAFRVLGPDGHVLTDFEQSHGKRLHLIVVRRDLSSFQHVHPTMTRDGVWTSELDLSDPGPYRVFADFKPAGSEQGYTLGHDLTVPGSYQPRRWTPPSRTVTVDGYEVALSGDLVPGSTSEVTLTVRRDGKPVTDLEPYLEAYGHLVAIRDGDLAYLHVHPDGAPGDGSTRPGPDITFLTEVPSAGRYRLFLDFQHEGRVRTAVFTVPVESHTH